MPSRQRLFRLIAVTPSLCCHATRCRQLAPRHCFIRYVYAITIRARRRALRAQRRVCALVKRGAAGGYRYAERLTWSESVSDVAVARYARFVDRCCCHGKRYAREVFARAAQRDIDDTRALCRVCCRRFAAVIAVAAE